MSERGQGLVEFAVIFPLLIMLIFVMIDGGLLMGNFGRINHAVSEGGRYGAVGASKNQIIDRVIAQSNGLIDRGNTTPRCPTTTQEEICVQWYRGPNGEDYGEVGSRVKVAVHYHYFFLTPIDDMVGGFGGPDHFSIDACTVVTLERPTTVPAGDRAGGSPSC
jgi:Flp pilus assembly protein TadG